MKKLLSAAVCIALLLSFTLSVSAAGPCILLTDWSASVLQILPKPDPKATPAPSDAPTPTPVADQNVVLCANDDYYNAVANFSFNIVDFDGGKGVQIKNDTGSNSGKAGFTLKPNITSLTDLSDVDTLRIRVKTDCTRDNYAAWFTNNSIHSSRAGSPTFYDLNKNEVTANKSIWGGALPAMPAGFDGYVVIDLNTTVNFGAGARREGVTFADIQSDFIDASLGETWRFQFMDQTLDTTDSTGGMLPGESVTVGRIELVSSDDIWAVSKAAAVTATPGASAPGNADGTPAPAGTPDFPTVPVIIGAAVVIIAVAGIIFVGSKKKNSGAADGSATEKKSAEDKEE